METTTMWAVALRGIAGPVLMFFLFGAAWLGGVAVWKWMPQGRLRSALLLRMRGLPSYLIVLATLAACCLVAAVI